MKKLLLSVTILITLACFSVASFADEQEDGSNQEMGSSTTFLGPIAAETMANLIVTSLTAQKLTLFLNSPGGDVDLAISFYLLMKNIEEKPSLTTVCLGSVSSSAVILFCSAEKRLISKKSFMILHPMDTSAYSINRKTKKKMKDFLTKTYSEIVSSATNGKLKPEDVTKMMEETTFLTGEDAVRLGIATGLFEE